MLIAGKAYYVALMSQSLSIADSAGMILLIPILDMGKVCVAPFPKDQFYFPSVSA